MKLIFYCAINEPIYRDTHSYHGQPPPRGRPGELQGAGYDYRNQGGYGQENQGGYGQDHGYGHGSQGYGDPQLGKRRASDQGHSQDSKVSSLGFKIGLREVL